MVCFQTRSLAQLQVNHLPDLLALQTSPGKVNTTVSPVGGPPRGNGLTDAQCLEAVRDNCTDAGTGGVASVAAETLD